MFAKSLVLMLTLVSATAFADGKCQALKGKGASCSAHNQCSSKWCNNSQCTDTKKKGESCNAHVECSSGYCLDGQCKSTK